MLQEGGERMKGRERGREERIKIRKKEHRSVGSQVQGQRRPLSSGLARRVYTRYQFVELLLLITAASGNT